MGSADEYLERFRRGDYRYAAVVDDGRGNVKSIVVLRDGTRIELQGDVFRDRSVKVVRVVPPAGGKRGHEAR